MKAPLSLDTAAITAYSLNMLLPLTAVCLTTLIAARWLFRHHPSVRYFTCLAGLIGILLSPLVVCLQDRLGYGLVTLSLPGYFSASPAPEASVSLTPLGDARINAEGREAPLTQTLLTWGVEVGLCVWGTGVAWGAVRFARGCKEASRLTEGICPWKASTDRETRDRLERVLDCPLPPVFTSPCVVSPVAVGLFRPVVILPEGLTETLAPAQLRQVLLHECAHVAFRHTFGGVVERVARLLFWPHPLVRALCRELARAREEVCDNVASQEDGAACYARTLFALAQGMFTAPNLTSALTLLGPENSLEDRITGLLDPRRNRMVRVKREKLWLAIGLVACAMASTAAVRVAAGDGKAKQDYAKAEADALAAKRKAEAEAIARHITVPVGQHADLGQVKVQLDAATKAALTEAKRKAEAKASGRP
jgi:beta-lactamase regulating signal transducer with metallopeptidase domain